MFGSIENCVAPADGPECFQVAIGQTNIKLANEAPVNRKTSRQKEGPPEGEFSPYWILILYSPCSERQSDQIMGCYASHDRQPLLDFIVARQFEGQDYELVHVTTPIPEVLLGSPRAISILRFELYVQRKGRRTGFRRDFQRELFYAGYRSLGQLADVGEALLQKLKFPREAIEAVEYRLAGFGLRMKRVNPAEANVA